jgi:glycine/D-amino acid oxidase-like deaminating enzyme
MKLCRKKPLIYASDLERPSSDLPSKAKVVICGGGAQGAAIAYKLAQRGLGSDVVLIEQVSQYYKMSSGNENFTRYTFL